jgi:hypothetical protein
MSKFIDLTGQRFGRLVVIHRGINYKKQTSWLCECDCGKQKNIQAGNLKNGVSKSCGCLRKELIKGFFFKDITNQRFGKLVAIRECGIDKNGSFIWEFRCDCGNLYYNTSTKVRTGHSNSCGCLKFTYAPDNWLGKKSPKWNFNKTYEDRRGERKIEGYNEWRKNVYAKFNWKCVVCGNKGGRGEYKLNAHHLESYQYNKELRCNVNNGVSICKKCHVDFHKKYSKVTTKKDFENYLNERNNSTT